MPRTTTPDCDEWLRLMEEIAAVDRDEYRRLRAGAWEAAIRSHRRKTPQQLASWRRNAS
jgi:hypothetical protein